MNQVDPAKTKRKEAKNKSKEALGKLGIDLSTLDLNEHEEVIASEVVSADEIQVTFKGPFGLGRLQQYRLTLADPAPILQTLAASTPSSLNCAKPSSSLCATRSCLRALPACLARQRVFCCTVRPDVAR